MESLGIIFAIGALLSWGFGDFFIQRATRKTSPMASLFFICLTSSLILPFFLSTNLTAITYQQISFLSLTALVAFFAGLFYFQALDKGKISIVEPILGLELPVTIGLSIVILKESLSLAQGFLIISIVIGIVLAITKHHSHLFYHKRIFEKGVMVAGIGAISMGLMNFLVGSSSKEIDPLFVIWYIHLIILIFCLAYFLINKRTKNLFFEFKSFPKLIAAESVLDNLAWILYSYATSLISISIATAISESYIALAVMLGIFVGKEKIKTHQLLGALIAIISVIILSII